jgi:DNA replication and repair protein RecF
VKGDPDGRRRNLDELLTLRTPRLAGVRADYERVLKQRNTLLRSSGGARGSARESLFATLSVWDEQLVRHGCELVAARLRLIRALRPLVQASYHTIAPGRGTPGLTYRASVADATGADDTDALEALVVDADAGPAALATRMQEALERVRRQELERGVTLVGPHRDDLVLSLGDLPARGFASHGESWSLVLSLRLAAHDLLTADGDEPVLVLDDVFAELDVSRRAALAERVAGSEQVLVTAAVGEDVPAALRGDRFEVTPGEVNRVD